MAGSGYSGEVRIEIIKIDGNKVNLIGYAQGGISATASDKVSGRMENSTLLLTWPDQDCKDKYTRATTSLPWMPPRPAVS